MSIYHLNTYLSFICRHHGTSYRPDHAICSDSSNHFAILTATSTPLYHQHQGNGTYYLATSLKRKTLTYSNLCYVTIILQSIANIIYYIKTHGSVSCGPRSRRVTPVSILTGRKKTQFSHLRSSVLP